MPRKNPEQEGTQKPGRPPLSEEERARRESLPSFLWETGSGVKVTVSMDNPTKLEFDEYIKWASSAAGLTRNETEMRFLSPVIAKGIKGDPAFQAFRAKRRNPEE